MSSTALLEAASAPPTDDAIETAIERTRAHVAMRARSHGGWDEPCDAGPAPTAHALVALHEAKALDPALRAGAIAWLVDQQASDGGFVAYPGARHRDVGATASALAALLILAPKEHVTPIRAAERFLEERGGERAVLRALHQGDLGAVYLALAGGFSAARLPSVPRPELAIDLVERVLARSAHVGVPLLLAQLAVVRAWLLAGRPERPHPSCRGLAERVLAYCDEAQNPGGGFVNIVPYTALALIAMLAAGRESSSDGAARAIAWLEREVEARPGGRAFFPVFHSGVWTTALSVRALAGAGTSVGSRVARRGLDWLLDAQSTAPQALRNQRTPGAVRSGGFGFQADNVKMTDCDDTAVATSAIAACIAEQHLPTDLRSRARQALERSVKWLAAMQNSDGGYPAFVHGLPGKQPGPVLLRPLSLQVESPVDLLRMLRDLPMAMGDPSTEDVTARVLSSLASTRPHVGHDLARSIDGQSQAALKFLREQSPSNGAFWSRWSTNYLWGTAHVIMGACAMGIAPTEAWLRRAVDFLVSHANEDGGFGETIDSYRNPELAGVGPSMPAVTGVVLEALVAAGEHASRPATRAVAYLLRQQRADGGFANGGHLQVIIPPDSFYRYPAASYLQPLLALGAWRAASGRMHPSSGGAPC